MASRTRLEHDLLTCLPHLRAFAISLLRDSERADDLVQETLTRALANLHRFEPGTNFQGWLFTILRNLFYTQMRVRRREVEDPQGTLAAGLVSVPEQMGHLAVQDLQAALMRLPPHHREALLLVGAQGLSYEEAALICGCPVGTIKSRLNRGREQLAVLMHETDPQEIGHDSLTLAALPAA